MIERPENAPFWLMEPFVLAIPDPPQRTRNLSGPLSAGQELAVSPLGNEYVREHFVAYRETGCSFIPQAGRKEDPFPIVVRTYQLSPPVYREALANPSL